MTEQEPKLSPFKALEQKVLAGKADAEEIRDYMIQRDLEGLATTKTYLKESQWTKEWECPDCGGPIPCSIDCPQCGHARPEDNFDVEQEGTTGLHRKRAGFRDFDASEDDALSLADDSDY